MLAVPWLFAAVLALPSCSPPPSRPSDYPAPLPWGFTLRRLLILPDAEILRIRRRQRQRSYSKVAAEFGVSRSLVAQIVRGELWQ